MAFKTKLQLSNGKFEQISGQTLSLSGNTIFTGKITIDPRDGITGGTDAVNKNYVDGLITAVEQSSSLYTGATPSNVEVGGLTVGSQLTGRTISNILQTILIKTFTPTFVAPSLSTTENTSNTKEVGTTATYDYTATFSRGLINGDIVGSTWDTNAVQGTRSGQPTGYTFTGVVNSGITTNLNQVTVSANYIVAAGANNQSATVSYEQGQQPVDSEGNDFGSPLPAGSITDAAPAITGIYPYFYGTDATTKPTANTLLLADAQAKVVQTSDGTVVVPYNTGGAAVYTWLAIPSTSTDKLGWFASVISKGNIATSSPTSAKYVRTDNITVNSPDGFWSSINYDFYISEQVSVEETIEFRNAAQA